MRALKALHNREVLQRLDPGVNALGDLTNPRALQGRPRKECRLRAHLLEVLKDSHRLADRLAPCLKHRDLRHGVFIFVGGVMLLSSIAHQVDREVLCVEALVGERDAHSP